MKKSVLLGIVIAAVVLSALPAFGLALKQPKPWPTIPVKVKIGDIPVWLDMPYFVRLREEPLKIQLEQIITAAGVHTLDFDGHAKDKDGNVPKIMANFDATVSKNLTRTGDGSALQGDGGKWTCTLNGGGTVDLTKMVEIDLDVYVKVAEANLNAWPECENRVVANVELFIIPR